MSSNKIYPLICLLVFSITTAYGAGDEDPLYKILKIKTQGGLLCVIHAQRNDSLFKIISKIVSLDKKPDLEQLRKGKSYYFDFGRTNHDTTKVEAVPLSGSASYLHVKNSRFLMMVRQKSNLKSDSTIEFILPEILLDCIVLVGLVSEKRIIPAHRLITIRNE